MILKWNLVLVFFFQFLLVTLAQVAEMNIEVFDSSLSNVTYTIYSPKIKSKAIYKSQEEALNLTPESLVESIMSTTNQNWVNYNQFGGEARIKRLEFFDNVKSMNKEANFSLLEAKLSFFYKNKKYALIKYKLNTEKFPGRQIGGCYMFIYENNRWYKTDELRYYWNLLFVMLEFKPEVLGNILIGSNSRSTYENDFRNRILVKGRVSFDLLIKEYNNLNTKSRSAEYDLFTEPTNW